MIPLDRIKELRKIVNPTAAIMIMLGGLEHRDQIFIGPEALANKMGLPEDACPLFTFEKWSHPIAGDPASISYDITTMVEALRQRKKITKLVNGTSHAAHLLDRFEVIGGWEENPAYWGVEEWEAPFTLFSWCQHCTTELHEAEVSCPNCGMDLVNRD